MLSKLSRKKGARQQVISNLAKSLITNEKLETTVSKARTVIPYIEKILTLAKSETESSQRRVAQKIQSKSLYTKIANSNIKKIKTNGGLIQIRKTGFRKGDNAPMVRITLNPEIFKKSLPEPSKKKEVSEVK